LGSYWWQEVRCGQRGRHRFDRIESRSRLKDRSGATIASNPSTVIVEGKVGATVWLLLPRDEPLSVVAREVWIRR
jgi:hypothetical protein